MKDSRLTPRINETAKGLWMVYFAATIACVVAYRLAGMAWLDAMMHAAAIGIASGNQPQDGPCRLRRSAGGRREDAMIVAGAGLAPSAVCVLDGSEPFARPQNMRFAIAFPGRLQTPQGDLRRGPGLGEGQLVRSGDGVEEGAGDMAAPSA